MQSRRQLLFLNAPPTVTQFYYLDWMTPTPHSDTDARYIRHPLSARHRLLIVLKLDIVNARFLLTISTYLPALLIS